MRVHRHGDKKRIVIDPGEYYVSNEHVVISTLLGSCVAACLYDPVNRVIGMNHFLLANRRYAKNIPVIASEAGRYGIHAMELLINSMLKMGVKRENLRAKAFGGGNVIGSKNSGDNFFAVGDVNARFIQEFLRNERIPLISSDLGGNTGRVIHFVSEDYSIFMKKIEHCHDNEVVEEEHLYWEKSIVEHEKEEQAAKPGDVVFW